MVMSARGNVAAKRLSNNNHRDVGKRAQQTIVTRPKGRSLKQQTTVSRLEKLEGGHAAGRSQWPIGPLANWKFPEFGTARFRDALS